MEVCGLVLLAWLLSPSIVFVTGVVELSPSTVAPVCQVGDQLQLTCTSSGIVHRWEFTVFPENMTYPTSPVTSQGSSGVPTEPLTFSSSMVTFSRLSSQNESPLVSRVVVSPVSSGLNGTVVSCFEGLSSTDSVATTTIRIIDATNFDLIVRSHPEQFMSDGVTISLEWALLNIQIYYQQLLRSITINVVPPIRNVMFTGNMRAQLVLSYNTLYNVSITQDSTCQQLVRTKFLSLNYRLSKCGDPMELTNVLAVGYEDPALEGQTITFTCPSGQILNESNTSTCMGNGIWEPDPGNVKCTGGFVTTVATPTLVMCDDPLHVLHILSDSVRDLPTADTNECCSGFLLAGTNERTCLESGEWELETSRMKLSEGNTNSDLISALISVSCLLVVASLLMFIIGFICGHCFNQGRHRKLTRQEPSMGVYVSTAAVSECVEDLELKENVAYITIHPK